MFRPPRPLWCCTQHKTVARLRSQQRSVRLRFRRPSCRAGRRFAAARRQSTRRSAQTPRVPQITVWRRKRRIATSSSRTDQPGAAGSRCSAVPPAGGKTGDARRRPTRVALRQSRRLRPMRRWFGETRHRTRRPGSGNRHRMSGAMPQTRRLRPMRPWFERPPRRPVRRLGNICRRRQLHRRPPSARQPMDRLHSTMRRRRRQCAQLRETKERTVATIGGDPRPTTGEVSANHWIGTIQDREAACRSKSSLRSFASNDWLIAVNTA